MSIHHKREIKKTRLRRKTSTSLHAHNGALYTSYCILFKWLSLEWTCPPRIVKFGQRINGILSGVNRPRFTNLGVLYAYTPL